MRLIFQFIFLFLLCQYNDGQMEKNKKIRTMNFGQLEPYLHQQNDTLYLVNFWATWCVPCRKELPSIEKVGAKYSNKKFRILLVSLDIPNELEKRVVPFIHSNQIKSEVILLDDPNQNEWIDKVDSKWSGEIPFTIIYGRHFRQSYAHSFNFQELDSIINLKINTL
jgi:thiol-disulfide isomerase/thioredoxin